jgi:hypothetical protein
MDTANSNTSRGAGGRNGETVWGPGAPARPGCLHYILFVLVSAWILAVTLGIQGGTWLAGQILLIQEMPMPGFAWLLASGANAVLLLLALVPLAILTGPARLRIVYECWCLATIYMFALTLVRFLPETRTQLAALAQIALALVCLVTLLRIARRRGYSLQVRRRFATPAPALAAILALPWPALGALGSPMNTLLNLLAGLLFGLFAAALLDAFLLRPLAAHPSSPGRDTLFGGFAAGVALAVLSAGFGFGGSQLLLMAALPSLGFAIFALARPTEADPAASTGTWLPAASLAGIVAAAAMIFIDPKGLTLLLDQGDIPTWAAWAASISILLAWVAGLGVWLFRRDPNRRWPLGTPRTSAAAAWLAFVLVYFVFGRPGFYGDQLFVILKSQPDVSQANSIPDRTARTSFVYETLARNAATTQAGLRADLDRLHIGYRPYYLVDALEVDADPLLGLYLSSRPDVDRVLDSPHLRPLPRPLPQVTGDQAPPAQPEWNITSIGVDRVWKELGVTGKGLVIGQSDSGVEGSHPALRDGYRGRNSGDAYNWLDTWNGTPSPADASGHGTHTLGIALGRGGIGVAPDAEWFACVNLARNLANPGHYVDCMQFMLAPYPQGGNPFTDGDPTRAAHITNNSWGCPDVEGCDVTSLLPAAAALKAAGIFVATSAGNSGPRCSSVLDPIAIYQDVFTAGAMDANGNIADFSSRGPVTVDGSGRVKPDILTPGVDILSSFPGGSYQRESGTSMAGPNLAGVVALMWSAQPRLIGDIDRTEQIIASTAQPYKGDRLGCFQGGTPNDAYGYGVIDAYAAVSAALQMK